MWGEIRYARPWDVRGHEPDGEHPNLVVGWRLTREDGLLPPSYPRGAVYEELIAGIGAVPRRSVVLRHNEGNGIALAMAIGNGDRLPDDSPVTIESSPELRGQYLLHGFVRPMAAAKRLGSFVSQLDDSEVGAAVAKLLSLTYPGAQQPMDV